jgi:oxygen-independent coproporphyrinogen-3 oxidase
MTVPLTDEATEVGSYFVANYPPFSFWKAEHLHEAEVALGRRGAGVPLGLYLHIPFCRKRCKFCYFRVYTDKNSREVERYVAALARELELYSRRPALEGRKLEFVYFGGGTPSFLSQKQLLALVERIRQVVDWDGAEEVTFECEPGTLNEGKLEAIRKIGVTRLSLGVENFSDAILEGNGRAHQAPEVFASYAAARRLDFDEINIDLIAGMAGETWENWKECIRKALELAPDSITIYQMELPFNTVYSRQHSAGGDGKPSIAGWKTKREWVSYAFDVLLSSGYHLSSAYTLVRDPARRFVYRDLVWRGADMIGAGVASFSHLGGVHYQNVDGFEVYAAALESGRLPLGRALRPTRRQLLIRELILQLKLGRVEASYFRAKFGVEVREEFAAHLRQLEEAGFLRLREDAIELTRSGLLRADSLLEGFFEPEHQNARYT